MSPAAIVLVANTLSRYPPTSNAGSQRVAGIIRYRVGGLDREGEPDRVRQVLPCQPAHERLVLPAPSVWTSVLSLERSVTAGRWVTASVTTATYAPQNRKSPLNREVDDDLARIMHREWLASRGQPP